MKVYRYDDVHRTLSHLAKCVIIMSNAKLEPHPSVVPPLIEMLAGNVTVKNEIWRDLNKKCGDIISLKQT